MSKLLAQEEITVAQLRTYSLACPYCKCQSRVGTNGGGKAAILCLYCGSSIIEPRLPTNAEMEGKHRRAPGGTKRHIRERPQHD